MYQFWRAFWDACWDALLDAMERRHIRWEVVGEQGKDDLRRLVILARRMPADPPAGPAGKP